MRQPKDYLVYLMLLLFSVNASAAVVIEYEVADRAPRFKKSLIVDRLESIQNSVDLKFNSDVKKHIKSFAGGGRVGTEYIVGRSAIYFPIFEYYLNLYNLPEDLKYLPIVESALKPDATSPMGAGGLWQFMKATGRQYGLEINNYVDERYDIHKSSEAAARMLSDLYDQYGDWSLVLAAYNCGSGNVNKAIKKSGETDFWKLRKHLPKETRNYVPKFIAASYIMNYYHFYNIRPRYPDYDLQITAVTKIYNRQSFQQLADASGIDIETIRLLNPSFKKQIIPPSAEGYNVVLPRIGLVSTFEYELFGAN